MEEERHLDKNSYKKYFKTRRNHEIYLSKNDRKIKRRKSRFKIGKWKKEEHDKFLELYLLHGSNWPKVKKKF